MRAVLTANGLVLRAPMANKATSRIRILSGAFVFSALLILTRLFFVQIVHGDEYQEKAEQQYVGKTGTSFNRGTIYFSSRDSSSVAAATLSYGYTLAIHPAQITEGDREKLYMELSRFVAIDKSDFLTKAAKQNDPYEELLTRVDPAVAKKIEEKDLKGVSLSTQRWRSYPSGTLAAHTIGFVGYEGAVFSGRYGLEKEYERVLGRNEEKESINFFAELFSELGDTLDKNSSREGDIYLTIEPIVQDTTEKAAQGIMEKYQAEEVGIVVMEPLTGALRAMAALPSFDPGEKKGDLAVLQNPLIEKVYEMGSIVKPLTMAAALDAGVVTRDTTYNDKGFVIVNNARIENFDKKGRGVVPMQEVLNNSLNTGAVFAMQKLGRDRFRTYMRAYGFGEKTGIDLPDEVTGLTDNLESTRDVEYATASFGQGVAVTPLAMTRALAALGNGGMMVTPYVVQEIRYKTLLSEKTKPEIVRRVIKPETSEEISRMLITVFDKALGGGKYKMEHYSIAAKTGTAQVSKDTGGYYEDRYLHSFFGYFPAYSPKFIIFLYVLNPKGARYASETLSDPFADLAKFLINYYRIPPDR